MEGMIVSQLRKERFPVRMSAIWKKIWQAPFVIEAHLK
jgi:hypothetical protein